MARKSTRLVRRKIYNALPNLLPFAVTFLHVYLSPYTKVEESFTLHAVHDVLDYGPILKYLSSWDHVEFPGAVPRSFLPPIILGVMTYPLAAISVATGFIKTKIGIQILLRIVLAAIFSISLNHLCRTIRLRFGSKARWFCLGISLSQFHIPYYAGRTLPNFMALPGVILGISLILRSSPGLAPKTVIDRRTRNAIMILTAVSTNIRLEIALLLLPTVLSLILLKRIHISSAILYGVVGGLGSIILSAPIDYTLWYPTLSNPSFPFTSWQFIWPELSGIHYNILNNQASNWGTSPWWYYFVIALPKLLLTSIPLAGFGVGLWMLRSSGGSKGGVVMDGVEETVRVFGLGIIGLVGGMSLVGHKEWRFIVYVVPIINILAALGATSIWNLKTSRRIQSLIRLAILGALGANTLFTFISTIISSNNYPGGQAMRHLEHIEGRSSTPLIIHLTSFPLQTGASLFTFQHTAPQPSSWPFPALPATSSDVVWTYSKGEDPTLNGPEIAWKQAFNYVIMNGNDAWTASERWEEISDLNLGGSHVQLSIGGWHYEKKWDVKIMKRVEGFGSERPAGNA